MVPNDPDGMTVVPFLNPRAKRITNVWAAQRIAEHPSFVLVLGFWVGDGRTDLAVHAILPVPAGWASAERSRRRWLGEVRQLLAPSDRPGTTERLTTAVVRSTTTAAIERAARTFITGTLDGFLLPAGSSGPAHRGRGPQGKGDVRLAQLAARYVQLTASSARPVDDLAREENLAHDTVASYLYRARDRGLLTKAGSGKAGGTLTLKAEALIKGASQ